MIELVAWNINPYATLLRHESCAVFVVVPVIGLIKAPIRELYLAAFEIPVVCTPGALSDVVARANIYFTSYAAMLGYNIKNRG